MFHRNGFYEVVPWETTSPMQKWGTEGFIVVFKGINQGRDRVLIAIRQDTSSLEILDQLVSNGDGFPLGMFPLCAVWLLNTCNAQDSTQHIQLPSPKCQQWQGENTYCRPVLVHFIVHTSHQTLGFKCNFWSPVGPETAFLTHSQVMLKLQVFLFWGPQSE